MARKYVCAYYDWLVRFAKCDDAELGRLLRAAIDYAREGIEPSFAEDTHEDLFWPSIRAQIDNDGKNYKKKSDAGQKGNESRWGKKQEAPKHEEQPVEAPANIQEYINKIKAWKDSM